MKQEQKQYCDTIHDVVLLIKVSLKLSKRHTIDIHTVIPILTGSEQLHQVYDSVDQKYQHCQDNHLKYEVEVVAR